MDLKVVFAGPSIHGVDIDFAGIDLRRPAQQGDVEQAVADGAQVIGLIDGHYQQVGAVWHKELLFALSSGVAVYGAASIGALRAAECEAFGMKPVGIIAQRYCSGELVDDADVALLNAPAEMGYQPITEPLVNAMATIDAISAAGAISPPEHDALLRAAKTLFFADRSPESIVATADLGGRKSRILACYLANRVDLKAIDAALLVDAVRQHRASPPQSPRWSFAKSPFWRDRQVRSFSVTPP
jgi:hypothetical protein